MKILIDNRTNLSNVQVGELIDTIISYENPFHEKWLMYELTYKNKYYQIETLPIKRYLKVFIIEIERRKL